MTVTERLENLEGCVSRLVTRVDQLEAAIANIQASSTTFNPYSGNAFQSPFGKPFRYSTVNPVNPTTPPIDNETIIIQKLDRIIDLFNNNFSRLNWRLEALENQRKE